MSIRVMSVIWESAPIENASELLVLLTLADHADDDGENAYPGIARIAHRCRLSERRVQQIIKGLEARGLIMVATQGGGSYGTRSDRRPNRYSLLMDGVKPTSPRCGNGVKSSADNPTNGVKPTSPDPIVITSPTGTTDTSMISSLSDESSGESLRLGNLLSELMVENGCKRPTVSEKWLRTLDRMHRIDGRSWEAIEGAIRWSQSDDFWAANVHSPDALRKHFEKMRMQASRTRTEKRSALDGVHQYIKEMVQ